MWSSQAWRDGCSLLDDGGVGSALVPMSGGGGGKRGRRTMPTSHRHRLQFSSSLPDKMAKNREKPLLCPCFSPILII
uniref:Uncharacterized protein n=1 Tax=Ditylenchus dipsaci TaxID=166011 RepID=A0A915CYL5_9BILA